QLATIIVPCFWLRASMLALTHGFCDRSRIVASMGRDQPLQAAGSLPQGDVTQSQEAHDAPLDQQTDEGGTPRGAACALPPSSQGGEDPGLGRVCRRRWLPP